MVLPLARIIAAAALATPLMANAVVYQFNATLNGANEVPTPVLTSGNGTATLYYDDFNTASTADDKYDFSLLVNSLSGPATGFHIHGPANASANAGVLVNLGMAPFVSGVSGTSMFSVGLGLTPPSSTFLSTLQSGLAYVNVHTALHGGGEVRGQLMQVTAVPEPETYALLLAGLGLIGAAVQRRKAAAAS